MQRSMPTKRQAKPARQVISDGVHEPLRGFSFKSDDVEVRTPKQGHLFLCTVQTHRETATRIEPVSYALLIVAVSYEEAVGKAYADGLRRFPRERGYKAPIVVVNFVPRAHLLGLLAQVREDEEEVSGD